MIQPPVAMALYPFIQGSGKSQRDKETEERREQISYPAEEGSFA